MNTGIFSAVKNIFGCANILSNQDYDPKRFLESCINININNILIYNDEGCDEERGESDTHTHTHTLHIMYDKSR